MNENKSVTPGPSGVSRRTVVKGAAWAVPAIAVASSVPAMAASPGTITLTGEGCKLPGASWPTFKGYVFGITATNTTNQVQTINILSVTLNGEDLGDALIINLNPCSLLGTNSFTIGANQTLNDLVLLTSNAAASNNGQTVVTYTSTIEPGTFTAQTGVNANPPLQGGSCTAFTNNEKDCIETFGSD